MRQRALVARHLPVHALLVRIAPAGVHPDLGVDAHELAVAPLREALGVGAAASGARARRPAPPTSWRWSAGVKNWRSASVQSGRVERLWCGGSSTWMSGQPAAESSRNSAFMMSESSLMSFLSLR